MAIKRFPIALRELEVVAVTEISPRLRRITLGGAQMGGFVAANGQSVGPFRSEGPDDHVKIFLPDPKTGILTLPSQADGHLDWPVAPRPTAREYTPRGYRDGDQTLDLEFVLHGHGLAGEWAASARIGDRLHIAGPKAAMIIPDADWYMLVGDETALPAIANWLEMLPVHARVRCLILVEDDAARLEFKAPRGTLVDWLPHRPDRPQALRDAVAGLKLPEGEGFIWGAGEREAIRLLRDHLVRERGFPKARLDVSAYWHHGVDDAMVEAAYEKFEAAADLARPLALRAAATLGLAEHMTAGATTLEALAAASACRQDVLAMLLPVLIEADVLSGTPEALSLGLAGQILAHDDHARAHLDLNAAPGRRGFALAGLTAALAGGDAYARVHGRVYAADARSPDLAGSFAHEHGHLIEDSAEDAAKAVVLAPGAHVVDAGDSAGAFLLAVIERHPDVTGTLLAPAGVLAVAREAVAASAEGWRATLAEALPGAPVPVADAYLLAGTLGRLDDAAAQAELARHAAVMTDEARLYVLEPGQPESPRWRLELALSAGLPRSHDAIAPLAGRAGLAQVRRLPMPEGAVLFEFARI